MKPRTRTPLIVASVVVVAVVAGTAYMQKRTPAPTEIPQAAGGELRQDPPSDVSAPDGALTGSARGARQSAGVPIEQQMQATLERRAEMRERQAARTRALREQSASRYASEQVDPAWAPGKERELSEIAANDAFQQAGAKPASLSVDCRSSMCRIDGQFGTRSQAEDWVMMYMSSVGGAMPNSIVSRTQLEDGSTRVEIYGRGR